MADRWTPSLRLLAEIALDGWSGISCDGECGRCVPAHGELCAECAEEAEAEVVSWN